MRNMQIIPLSSLGPIFALKNASHLLHDNPLDPPRCQPLPLTAPSLIARVRWSRPLCPEEEEVRACKIGPFCETVERDALVFPEVSRKKKRPEFERPKTGSFYLNLRKVKGVWQVFFSGRVWRLCPYSRPCQSGGWQQRVRNCDQVSGSWGRVRDSGHFGRVHKRNQLLIIFGRLLWKESIPVTLRWKDHMLSDFCW